MPIIEIEGLTKVYHAFPSRSVQALRGVDLRVERGQAFGLLGPNGAGKTTLVKVLLGLVQPTRGSARLLGTLAGTPGARAGIGYMPEHRQYPAFLSAKQVLELFARLSGLPASIRPRRIDAALQEVELDEWRGHRVGGFSKGMRQRLALAQALINEPEILFLDEPAEGIDPLGRVVVRNILRRCREKGTTLFINSHLLTEVEMVCDQVAILHGGRVAESGRLAEMTSREREYRLTVASAPESVPAMLDGAVEGIEQVRAPAGLFAWRLTVSDRSHLNAALDRLRSAAVEIEAIEPVRSSLEEVFLKAVKEAAARPQEPGSER
ncbi:MAG: ATP-binding cassette domain-containing protein [Acidobacteriota bacterium]